LAVTGWAQFAVIGWVQFTVTGWVQLGVILQNQLTSVELGVGTTYESTTFDDDVVIVRR